jgi:histidine triad (HIT) family protein
MSCLFCRIGKGEIPSEKIHDDGELFAIKDINPGAPWHALIMPHKHIETILDLGAGDEPMVGRVYTLAAKLARDHGFGANGYRVVANCNRDGGQTVFHIHFHVLAGRPMGWPPG